MARIRPWIVLFIVTGAMLCSCTGTGPTSSPHDDKRPQSGSPGTQSRAQRAIKVTCPPEKRPSQPTPGTIVIDTPAPRSTLIPAEAGDRGSKRLVSLLFSGLVSYDKTGKTVLDVAQSIQTDDSKVFTVTLQDGLHFSNGTPVQAHNFVDAWKLASARHMLLAHTYASIEGTNDSGIGDMRGLKTINDRVFTITLKEPQINFIEQLGQTSFYPLSDYALHNYPQVGNKPIGNGPYTTMTSDNQNDRAKFSVVPSPRYKGNRQPMNGGITLVYRSSPEAAYAQLQHGQLDVVTKIPISAFESYVTDFPCQNVNAPAASPQVLVIPARLKHFTGKEGLLRRQALSYAINRDKITERVFSGTRVSAKEFTSPILPGFNPHLPGSEVLTFNPEKAQRLWAQADALSTWDGQLTIYFTANSGDQEWIDAIARSLSGTLNITVKSDSYLGGSSAGTDIHGKKLEGVFHGSWQGEYPSRLSFLSSYFVSGSKTNITGYSSKDFDRLVSRALTASSADEATQLTDEAETLLLRDLPAVPLWNSNTTAGWTTAVDNVAFGWNGEPQLTQITRVESDSQKP